MNQREIFSKNLKKLFNESGKQQIELAEYLKVTKPLVTIWLRGTSYPRIDTLEKIAQFFGVPISYLYTEDPAGTVTIDATADEAELVDAYRAAEDTAREYAKDMLLTHPKKAMSSTSTSA